MKATCSSETSVLTGVTQRHVPEDGILHSHRREKSNLIIFHVIYTTRVFFLSSSYHLMGTFNQCLEENRLHALLQIFLI
jgi:hypothetical protein